jgi:hypothetical protein
MVVAPATTVVAQHRRQVVVGDIHIRTAYAACPCVARYPLTMAKSKNRTLAQLKVWRCFCVQVRSLVCCRGAKADVVVCSYILFLSSVVAVRYILSAAIPQHALLHRYRSQPVI